MAKDRNVKSKMYITDCPPMGKCIPQELVIRNVRLAAAYVPFQKMCTLLSPIEALRHGTAFPELYSPYEARDRKYRPVVKC